MIYLDSSVLVKRYIEEEGSKKVNDRFLGGDKIFTSKLSYAEVLAAFARKGRKKEIGDIIFERAMDSFVQDWVFSFSVLDLDVGTLAAIPHLVEQFPIRGADVVHLSAAVWLRDMCRLIPSFAAGDRKLEFGSADGDLVSFADECGLTIFNPLE